MVYRCRPQLASPSDAMVLRSPSPSGSEDSIETSEHKERWYYVARKVGLRWKFFVWRKQFWRLRANRLLMPHWWQRWPDNVGTEIYELAGGCARLQRIEPTPRLRIEHSYVCIDSRLPLLTRNIWVPHNGLRH